jgi:probable F420-dependent oxidoreductase
MKVAVEFPHTLATQGPEAVADFARGVERIGFDELDTFDHVVMALPTEGEGPRRPPGARLEALTLLTFVAAVTERIGIGTEVLVLPQRQPVLVAQQAATLDILSRGRLRLGVGVGWQEPEFEALGVAFGERGRRMDEAIALLRTCWREPSITYHGRYFQAHGVSMEPKPVQPGGPPIWVGGGTPAALRRTGRLGDGWLAPYGGVADAEGIAEVRHHAEEAGRDASKLGFQRWLRPLPRPGDAEVAAFYADPGAVAAEAGRAVAEGFNAITLNAAGLAASGIEQVDAMLEKLERLHGRIRGEVH